MWSLMWAASGWDHVPGSLFPLTKSSKHATTTTALTIQRLLLIRLVTWTSCLCLWYYTEVICKLFLKGNSVSNQGCRLTLCKLLSILAQDNALIKLLIYLLDYLHQLAVISDRKYRSEWHGVLHTKKFMKNFHAVFSLNQAKQKSCIFQSNNNKINLHFCHLLFLCILYILYIFIYILYIVLHLSTFSSLKKDTW